MKRFLALTLLSVSLSIAVSLLVARLVSTRPQEDDLGDLGDAIPGPELGAILEGGS
jgi:hypothetical protein